MKTELDKLMSLIEAVPCEGPEKEWGACPYRRDGKCSQISRLDFCAIAHLAAHLLVSRIPEGAVCQELRGRKDKEVM